MILVVVTMFCKMVNYEKVVEWENFCFLPPKCILYFVFSPHGEIKYECGSVTVIPRPLSCLLFNSTTK